MANHYLRKYGTEVVIDFELMVPGGDTYKVDAASTDNDTVIMKDEGAEANTVNLFVDWL